MKTMKLELVVFNISQENAVLLWSAIVDLLQITGFDVTGNVKEYDDSELSVDEINRILTDAEDTEE